MTEIPDPETGFLVQLGQRVFLDAEHFFQAFVKVQARAVPDARSSGSLGTEREGTGIVISDDGLVLTIGYLIIEADQVSLVDQQGRTLPARGHHRHGARDGARIVQRITWQSRLFYLKPS